MSIAIVSSFVQATALEASAEGGASGPTAVDDAGGGLDFASILLALPVSAVPRPLESGNAAAAGDMASLAAADPASAGLQFLAMLGLNQPNALPPASHPAGGSDSGEIAPLSVSLQTRSAALLASAATSSASDAAQWPYPGSDERGASASTTLSSDGKAAKFAVGDLLAQALAQGEAKRAEQALSPASNLATLGPASQAHNGSAGIVQDTSMGLQTALRDPSWATDFGQKLLWFAGNDKQLAQLTLNPPQLGTVEITLKIDKDSANAHFVSANAEVRGAIETALPRLREMFASAGIDLGQVSVGGESFRQQSDGQRQPAGSPRPMADTAILGNDSRGDLVGQSIVTHRGSALVDIFA